MANLYKIGEVAEICNVTIKALRYYEELCLIKPYSVDIYTGDRYYDEANVKEINKILMLKKLNFSLEEIKNINDDTIFFKQVELQNQIKELNKKLRLISSLKTEKGEIRATALTSLIPNLKDEEPVLLTDNRVGNCHSRAIKISNSLGEIDNDVVTGYVFGFSDKSKYLHTWVEFNYQGKDAVIDYNLNVLMNKEGYYLMTHALPLSRISNKNIHKDFKVINKLGKTGCIKEYLVFRDELMKDFKKNKELFDMER